MTMNHFLLTAILPPWLSPQRSLAWNGEGQPLRQVPAMSLKHYNTPGVFPPSARVDPKLKRHPRRPLHLWEYWKYPAFLVVKATEITAELLLHKIWGPRKKSWGIQTTIATSLIRGVGHHTGLIGIDTIRMVMNIAGLIPLPSDALATPVTFRVRKRNLRGLLASFDAAESGLRELSGEWVVGKKTWQRLQSEWKSSSANAPDNMALPTKERIILYIHGGAYYLSSAAFQRTISIPLARFSDARIFAIDYRLAPETQFPGPLHDVVSAYFRLVEDLHIPADNIVVCGDSAGGGLTLALLMYLRDNDYPLPSGAIVMSPWVDLTLSCESWDSNAMYDIVPFPLMDSHMNPIALYLGEHTEKYLTHPYASPLFGSFEGLPPLLIQAGDAEVLRDEISLLAHKARLAGVAVRHEVYDDAIHVFQAWPCFSATLRAFESMQNFMHNILPRYQAGSLQILGDTAERGMGIEIENEKSVVVGRNGVEMKDGNAKQRFKDEPDVSVNSSVSSSTTLGTILDSDEEDEYWEVEDVWEEDNWLRGDGEDGKETKNGIIFRRTGGSLSLNLLATDAGAKVVHPTTTNNNNLATLSEDTSSPPLSCPGTFSRQRFSDTKKGYLLDIMQVPRRVKSTTNLLSALRGSSSHHQDFTYSKSLGGSSSCISPQSRNLFCPSLPMTPDSTPSAELGSPFASCAFPKRVATPHSGQTALKSSIMSLS